MLITFIIIFVLFMLDQLTKYLAQVHAPHQLEAIDNFLTIDLCYNKGMAWGMLEDNTIILVFISIIASIILGYLCLKNDWKHNKFSSFTITMTFAGCLGNLFDRAISVIPATQEARPGVVDMISFEPLNYISKLLTGNQFPTFNLADAFLVVGLILYAIDLLFFADKRKKKYEEANN